MTIFNKIKDKTNKMITDHNERKETKAEERAQFLEENKDNLPKIFKATNRYPNIDIDEVSNLFKISGHKYETISKKKSKTGSAALFVLTGGLSSIASLATTSHKKGYYRYTDLVSYELLEDDDQVTSGGLGSAVVGGVLFGGVGAIVGSTSGKKTTKKVINNLSIKMTVNDLDHPLVVIQLINKKTKTKSKEYQAAINTAHKILSVLEIITKKSEEILETAGIDLTDIENVTADSNPYEEIKKLKELLDLGIISEEEFEVKKKEILGLWHD